MFLVALTVFYSFVKWSLTLGLSNAPRIMIIGCLEQKLRNRTRGRINISTKHQIRTLSGMGWDLVKFDDFAARHHWSVSLVPPTVWEVQVCHLNFAECSLSIRLSNALKFMSIQAIEMELRTIIVMYGLKFTLVNLLTCASLFHRKTFKRKSHNLFWGSETVLYPRRTKLPWAP